VCVCVPKKVCPIAGNFIVTTEKKGNSRLGF